ncbi:MAG: D-alanine--D-alanine ligase [Lentisphaeria bacterium]|nr:D-alanine--D-alanine ligase [Lentisphaeria bacterium]
MPKQTVCILCGGRSSEHEVSLQSALNVTAALDREAYKVLLVGIARDGGWQLYRDGPFAIHTDDPARTALADGGELVVPLALDGGMCLMAVASGERLPVDVVFPVLHGTFGEDGAVQGLLRMFHVPCVGCDVASSANCMDKDLAKRLMDAAEIPNARFVMIRSGDDWDADEIAGRLGLPAFVKPASQGSSVGVSKAKSIPELAEAIRLAMRYDTKVLVEEAVAGREIEVAVLGNHEPRASLPGEVIPKHEFYSYDAKYLDEDGAVLIAPAELDPVLTACIQAEALRVFRALGCSGMARVDFFLKTDSTLLVNELNTIPGFTRISMYPKLWEASGIRYPMLVDRLLQLALEQYADRQQNRTTR